MFVITRRTSRAAPWAEKTIVVNAQDQGTSSRVSECVYRVPSIVVQTHIVGWGEHFLCCTVPVRDVPLQKQPVTVH